MSRDRLLVVVLFVLVLLQTGTVAVREKAISPFDEAAHFDYVVQLLHGNFPVPAGQRYSEEAVQNWACRPSDRATSVAPLCGEPGSARDPRVPFGGINYEAPFGPVYYALAAAGSAVLGVVGVQDFTGARLVSALLYALGAAMLLGVALRMAASSIAAAAVILASSSSGLALSIGATIGPDSMAFLGAAAVIASAVLIRTWRRAVLSTTLLGAAAGLTKPNFILIALLGSMLLLIRWASMEGTVRVRRSAVAWIRLVAGLMLPIVMSAVASIGWATLAAARNHTGAQADGGVHLILQSSLNGVSRAAEQLWALLRPDGGTAPGPAFTVLDTPVLRAASLIVVVAALGACTCAWLWRMEVDRRGLVVLRAVALALPVSAVMLVVILWITYQGGHWTASRYALPFLAAASVGLGAAVTRRAAIPVALFGIGMWMTAWVGILARTGISP